MVDCLTRNVAPTFAQGGLVRSVLSYQSKRELVQQMAPRYQEASRAHKILMLDEFVAITSYARKYAIQLLNHPGEPKPRSQQARLPHYGPEVQQALLLAWKAANQICAKRLIPFLPTLVEALERHGHLHLTEERRNQLLSISATTADRLLRSQRKYGPRGIALPHEESDFAPFTKHSPRKLFSACLARPQLQSFSWSKRQEADTLRSSMKDFS